MSHGHQIGTPHEDILVWLSVAASEHMTMLWNCAPIILGRLVYNNIVMEAINIQVSVLVAALTTALARSWTSVPWHSKSKILLIICAYHVFVCVCFCVCICVCAWSINPIYFDVIMVNHDTYNHDGCVMSWSTMGRIMDHMGHDWTWIMIDHVGIDGPWAMMDYGSWWTMGHGGPWVMMYCDQHYDDHDAVIVKWS